MVITYEIELDESFGLTKPIWDLTNQRQWIPNLDCEIIELLIIETQLEATIKLMYKQNWSTRL